VLPCVDLQLRCHCSGFRRDACPRRALLCVRGLPRLPVDIHIDVADLFHQLPLMVAYRSGGPETVTTVDDTEGGEDAHCSAAKYGVLVERRGTEERSLDKRGPCPPRPTNA